MLHETPLRDRHARYQQRPRPDPAATADRPGAARGARVAPPEVEYVAYGPRAEDGEPQCELVAGFGEIEAEYAAIRSGAALFDAPHRGTLVVSGDERRDFLDRLVTQELKDLEPGTAREALLLNRKGRIEADLLLVETGDRTLVDVDVHMAAAAVATLEHYHFAEDVEIADATGDYHRIELHGPKAAAVLAEAAGGAPEPAPLQAATVEIAGAPVVVARRDVVGEVGLSLFVPYDRAGAVWDALLAAEAPSRRVRPVGWYALNIARVEAGTPLFNVDFGANNLPHETGLLRRRVSFTKGCYPGQEIVARTENLGRPRQVLVGLRPRTDRLPVAGAQVFAVAPPQPEDAGATAAESEGGSASGRMGPQIGVVTSSTPSPLRAQAPIALAMIRSTHADAGTVVLVNAEGEQVEATVEEPGGAASVKPRGRGGAET